MKHFSTVMALSILIGTSWPAGDTHASVLAEAKEAIRALPSHARDAGRQVGQTARATGQAIGRGAKHGYREVRDGARRDFGHGQAFKGPYPARHGPGEADP